MSRAVDRISIVRADLVQPARALAREWLVTNGLGGFACGTLAQANTRRYHGLLMASLRPPAERVLLLAKLEPAICYGGVRFELGCNEFLDGTVAPRGCQFLSEFHLEDGLPVWTYAVADALLEQRIWMAHGRNTTYVSFTLRSADGAAELDLLPLCAHRGYHEHGHGGAPLGVLPEENGCTVVAHADAAPYRLWMSHGRFVADPDWYWNFRHRLEAERGLDVREDLFRPGWFRCRLAPDETATFIVTAEAEAPEAPAASLHREQQRRESLLRLSPAHAPRWIRRLALAADQFIVTRTAGRAEGSATTVVAGYPWFADWGRDTMIALPGLTLHTGRAVEAASILRSWCAQVSLGMLPNRLPEGSEQTDYNTVDATLWYFHALAAYLDATGDKSLLRAVYPTLREIVARYRIGTRYSIHMDPDDGLLYAGEPGVQLTWMDAKVGDWVVTPRVGKPVEINALWHYSLTCMAKWASNFGDIGPAKAYEAARRRVATSFAESFWFEEGAYLYDVIDTPDGTPNAKGRKVDPSLRPNQILAVSLGADLLDGKRARAVVDACTRDLLTPVGLRSLSCHDPRYVGAYAGGPRERDAAYHQGTVWSWLLGPFVLAHHRVYGNPQHAASLLNGIAAHLDETCLGTISEIMDGDAPHAPRGCFAQAWSVGETLRAFHTLAAAQKTSQARFVQGHGD